MKFKMKLLVYSNSEMQIIKKQGWCSGESTRLATIWCTFFSVLNAIHGLSLLVTYSALRGFSPGTPLSPKTKNLISLIEIQLSTFVVSSITQATIIIAIKLNPLRLKESDYYYYFTF